MFTMDKEPSTCSTMIPGEEMRNLLGARGYRLLGARGDDSDYIML